MRERTRLEATIVWIGWHLGELAGVIGPIVLGVWLTWWFALISLATGTLWAVQEWRDHRAHARLRVQARARRSALTGPDVAQNEPVVHLLPREGA